MRASEIFPERTLASTGHGVEETSTVRGWNRNSNRSTVIVEFCWILCNATLLSARTSWNKFNNFALSLLFLIRNTYPAPSHTHIRRQCGRPGSSPSLFLSRQSRIWRLAQSSWLSSPWWPGAYIVMVSHHRSCRHPCIGWDRWGLIPCNPAGWQTLHS